MNNGLKVDWRFFVLAVVVGICICLTAGLVENPPEVSVVGYKYYGWPLVWRVTKTLQSEEYRYSELLVDLLLWIVVASVVTFLIKKLMKS